MDVIKQFPKPNRWKIFFGLLLFIGLAILLAGRFYQKEDSTITVLSSAAISWATYQNTDFGYAFEYPAFWSVEREYDGDGFQYVAIRSPEGQTLFVSNLGGSIDGKIFASLEEYVDGMVEQMSVGTPAEIAELFPGPDETAEILSRKTLEVGGGMPGIPRVRGIELTSRWESGQHWRQVFLEHNGIIYDILFAFNSAADLRTHEEIYQRMLSMFHFFDRRTEAREKQDAFLAPALISEPLKSFIIDPSFLEEFSRYKIVFSSGAVWECRNDEVSFSCTNREGDPLYFGGDRDTPTKMLRSFFYREISLLFYDSQELDNVYSTEEAEALLQEEYQKKIEIQGSLTIHPRAVGCAERKPLEYYLHCFDERGIILDTYRRGTYHLLRGAAAYKTIGRMSHLVELELDGTRMLEP